MATAGQNPFIWSDRMIEMLIVKVKSYSITYDYTLENFKDPEVRHNAFKEIAIQMGTDVGKSFLIAVQF